VALHYNMVKWIIIILLLVCIYQNKTQCQQKHHMTSIQTNISYRTVN